MPFSEAKVIYHSSFTHNASQKSWDKWRNKKMWPIVRKENIHRKNSGKAEILDVFERQFNITMTEGGRECRQYVWPQREFQ